MPEPRVCAVADNLLQALRFFGYARSTGEIHDLPGMSLIFCGLNYAAFNAALLARPVESNKEELIRLIRTASAQFGARNLRWTYWLCDDFLSTTLRWEANRIFSKHGLRPLTDAPGMYAERLLPPSRPLPVLEIRPVLDEATRAAFSEIMSLAFDIPHSICSAVYGTERAWQGPLRGYVGYSAGRPVTTAAIMLTGDVIGLYSVATVPRSRRMGCAEAIMRQVIEQTRQTFGSERTVLQATRSGYALYEKMGYRTVTKFNVYISE